MRSGLLQRYEDYLPITATTPALSLGEGSTPLVRSTTVGPDLGIRDLFFKLEGCNPTGSFKDRGMVVAVAKAVEAGHDKILCASTGNTSAAAAAYAAAAGLQSVVLVPEGDVAQGKLSQAMAYGARIIVLKARFDQALDIARSIQEHYEISLVNSVNPHRIEGQKTAAFEIVDELGGAPDELFIPVGNAGNITAYWKGFKEYGAAGHTGGKWPRMMGYEAVGAAPIANGAPVAEPKTVASAIRIGNPASWHSAETARDESEGTIDTVTDDEIIDAWRLLARSEGIFCEPASAASLAGLVKSVRTDKRLQGRSVVCVITGSGLKDPNFAAEAAGLTPEKAPADLETVAAMLGLPRGHNSGQESARGRGPTVPKAPSPSDPGVER